MANFIGTYFYSVDAKNRLAVPAKFRFSLAQHKELVIAQGLEGCLNLYTPEAWEKLNHKLENFPLQNKIDARAFKRMLFASASNVELDEEGRILIPQALVAYAQLKRDAAIIGMGEKIEIWSKNSWDSYQKKLKSAFSKHAAQLEI